MRELFMFLYRNIYVEESLLCRLEKDLNRSPIVIIQCDLFWSALLTDSLKYNSV